MATIVTGRIAQCLYVYIVYIVYVCMKDGKDFKICISHANNGLSEENMV